MMLNPSLLLLLGASAALAQNLVIDPACAQLAPMQSALAYAADGLEWCSSKEQISVGTTYTTFTTYVTEVELETSTSKNTITQSTVASTDATVFSGTFTSTAPLETVTATATAYVPAFVLQSDNES